MPLYRKNKYNESIEVDKYTCGSCANYQFEREDDTNYCTYFGKYYPYNDSCKGHWTEFSSGSSSGCFLTSACCEYKGLPDDCYELTVMRDFRDNVLAKTTSGQLLIDFYYKVAPGLVEKILLHSHREEILSWIYEEIEQIVKLVEAKQNNEAITAYVLLVLTAEQKISN